MHIRRTGFKQAFILLILMFSFSLTAAPLSFNVQGYTVDIEISQSEVPGYSVYSASAVTKKSGEKTLHIELQWEDSPVNCVIYMPVENGSGSAENVPCRTGKDPKKFKLILVKEYDAKL